MWTILVRDDQSGYCTFVHTSTSTVYCLFSRLNVSINKHTKLRANMDRSLKHIVKPLRGHQCTHAKYSIITVMRYVMYMM